MASATLADASAVLSTVYGNDLATQINSTSVPFYLLPVVPGEGKALFWTAEFTGAANAAATAEDAALDASDADDEDELPATLPWAVYTKTSSVTDLSQAGIATNYNPGSSHALNGDSLLGKVHRQARRLALGFSGDFYAGNPGASTPELAGLALAVDSSGTFAGIDPTVETEWAATELTGSLNGLNIEQVREFFTQIYLACGEYPEFCLAPANIFNKVRGFYDDYEANVVREVHMSRGGGPDGQAPRTVKLHGGMRAVLVDQIPIILDRFCTANTMYAINTSGIELQQLPTKEQRSIMDLGQRGITELFERVAGADRLMKMPREDVEGMTRMGGGIKPYVKLLGARGITTEAVLEAFVQIKYTRRNCHGKLVLS